MKDDDPHDIAGRLIDILLLLGVLAGALVLGIMIFAVMSVSILAFR